MIRAESTRQNADSVCAMTGGKLPAVTTRTIQMTLEVLLGEQKVDDAWIGAYDVQHMWQWASGAVHTDPTRSHHYSYSVSQTY